MQEGNVTKFRMPVVEFVKDVMYSSYMQNILNGLIDGWTDSDLDPKIIDKIKNLLDVAHAKSYNEYITNVEDFNVIIHGDLWCNNILFNYDVNGKVKNAKIVSLNFSEFYSLIKLLTSNDFSFRLTLLMYMLDHPDLI